MNKRTMVLLTLALHGLVANVAFSAEPANKPNIVLILADDLGYGDLGCFGQTDIQTPNIDRLAREGMKFTHFYAGASVCAPSRCVLMTGKHGGRCRVRGNSPDKTHQTLTREDFTVAAMLKQAGYATALVGKWGLGEEDMPGHPLSQGFDFFFGYLNQVHSHMFFPEHVWRNRERVFLPNEVIPRPVGKNGLWGTGGISTRKTVYSPKLMLDEALQFIEQNRQRPFFLYFATTIPHANNEAANEPGGGAEVPDLGPYQDKPWPEASKRHAAMITYLDTQVGAILQRLEHLGLDQNTLVLFSSDNGPDLQKFTGFDPLFFRSTGPFRGLKRDHYDGGIRMPTLARWPGKIREGSISRHVGYFGDFMATAAELAGVEAPAGLDSLSLAPTLLGRPEKQKQHEFLYWEYHGVCSTQAVLTNGRWKAVRNAPGAPLELYDLSTDVGEQTDVAARHPDVVRKIEDYLKTAREDSPTWQLHHAPSSSRN